MARRKSRYSGIGGQAVLEGVMMKNREVCGSGPQAGRRD
jgi:uncharacterized protein YqhQ